MSFFKKLFGGRSGDGSPAAKSNVATVSYNGYEILPSPQKDDNQYRLAGTITRHTDDGEKSHYLVRADVFSGQEEAVEATVRKAKRLIDEQGDAIFR